MVQCSTNTCSHNTEAERIASKYAKFDVNIKGTMLYNVSIKPCTPHIKIIDITDATSTFLARSFFSGHLPPSFCLNLECSCTTSQLIIILQSPLHFSLAQSDHFSKSVIFFNILSIICPTRQYPDPKQHTLQLSTPWDG